MLLLSFYRLDCRPDGSARSREPSKRNAAAIDRLAAFRSGVHSHRRNPIRRIQSVDVGELTVVCSGLVPMRWYLLENRTSRRVSQRVCGSDPCIGHLDLVAKRTLKWVARLRSSDVSAVRGADPLYLWPQCSATRLAAATKNRNVRVGDRRADQAAA